MELKQFVFGQGRIPQWFNAECEKGKARVDYDDEGNLVSATIHTPTKTIKAKAGDSIFLIKSGLQVVPKEKVKKNKFQKGKMNEENVEQTGTEV